MTENDWRAFDLFAPTDEHSLLGDTLREFVSREVEPGAVSQRYGAGGNGPSMYIRDPDGNTVELKGPPTEDSA